MFINLQNPYGYKVCYTEKGYKKVYNQHFITYTYNQAVKTKMFYLRYPPLSRTDNHKLNKPTWYIIQITKREVKRGIWRECPF